MLVVATLQLTHVLHAQQVFREQAPPAHGQRPVRMDTRESQFAAWAREIPAPTNEEELGAAVLRLADRLAAVDRFRGVIMVESGGQPLVSGAWGMADRSTGRGNSIETAFDIGSVGKFFTQIAILQLREEGKLDLDDAIGKHLPDYPNREAAQKVKIRHLLRHQGGLTEHAGLFSPSEQAGRKTLRELVGDFAHRPLQFEPGTRQGYSNSGYLLLGLIVEAVSGQSYATYVQTRILEPAGMKSSGFFDRAHLPAHVARSYEGMFDATAMHVRTGSPAGGMQATAPDMQRLFRAVNAGLLLQRDSLRVLTSEILFPNSHSTPAAENGRLAAVSYAGGAPGVSAMCAISRDGRHACVILANQGGEVAVDFWLVLRDWINRLPARS